MPPVTIKDIARELSISVSTVSYALNGGPRKVPAEVRERVLATAKALNYRPNRMARFMITGRRHVIGLVSMETGEEIYLSPYLQMAMNGLAESAARARQDFHLFTRTAGLHGVALAEALLDGQVDGVLFLAPILSVEDFRQIHEAGIPFVVVGGDSGGLTAEVLTDNDTGMHEAVALLKQLNHTRVGFVGGQPGQRDAREREKAMRAACASHGIAVVPENWHEGDFTIEAGERAFRHFAQLTTPPTAVVCANDEMAVGLHRAAQVAGWSIPQSLSIIGFDDTISSRIVTPAITTIRQPIAAMASAAFSVLQEIIEGREVASQVLPTQLIIRSSTSRPKEDTL